MQWMLSYGGREESNNIPLLKYIRNKEISCAANLVKDYS
jgi:hypothetical protein